MFADALIPVSNSRSFKRVQSEGSRYAASGHIQGRILEASSMFALAATFLENVVGLQLDSLLAIQLMRFALFGSCADLLVTRV